MERITDSNQYYSCQRSEVSIASHYVEDKQLLCVSTTKRIFPRQMLWLCVQPTRAYQPQVLGVLTRMTCVIQM